MNLTNIKVKNAPLKDKPYKLTDGRGLFLLVNPNGSKYWRFKYSFSGKEKLLALGVYPETSLADARELHEEARKSIRAGIDPSQVKKNVKKTFLHKLSDIAEEWLDIKKKSCSQVYLTKLRVTLDVDIFPVLGSMAVNEIKPSDVLAMTKIINDRGAIAQSNYALGRLSEIFTHAIVTERAEVNPCFGLSRTQPKYDKKNFGFLLEKDLPCFLKALNSLDCSSIPLIATKVLMYTGLRTNEVLQAHISEFNFKDRIWEIPAERMKSKKPHLVPLSLQVIKLIQSVPRLNDIYMFSNRRKYICHTSALNVIDSIGYKGRMTGHGFRHTMSTILHEHGFNSSHIELQLAHVDKNSIRGVYNHAQYLESRRTMLQWYADYLDELESKASSQL